MIDEQRVRILSDINRQMVENIIQLESALKSQDFGAVERLKSIILQLQQKFNGTISE